MIHERSLENAVRSKSTGSLIHMCVSHTHTEANTNDLVQIQAFQELVVEGEVHQELEVVGVPQVIQVVGVHLVLPAVEVVGVLLVLPPERVLGVPEEVVLGVVLMLPVV